MLHKKKYCTIYVYWSILQKKTYIDLKSRNKYTNSKNINENKVSKKRVKIPYIYI